VIRAAHPILNNLGMTIRRLRRQQGLSQEALADLAQIDRSYMSSIERGRRNLSLLNVARIAAALRVQLGELLYTQEASGEQYRRVSVAVDELSETLRMQKPAPVPASKARENAMETWKPGWYLSLS
jgi:transcriptional regulator with XRE-family HTH domain